MKDEDEFIQRPMLVKNAIHEKTHPTTVPAFFSPDFIVNTNAQTAAKSIIAKQILVSTSYGATDLIK
ncbi:MAG: hypothetical protein SPD47_09850 [Oscillospiraceae bacterium]|nr:hypothetical protein [Oscillospiraceae bacterium]